MRLIERIIVWITIAVAALHVATAIFGISASRLQDSFPTGGPPAWVLGFQILVFASSAGFLLVRGRSDARIIVLAAALAAVVSSFCRRPILALTSDSTFADPLGQLLYLRPDAFLPFLIWAFFSRFPESLPSRRLIAMGVAGRAVTLGWGGLLFFANALIGAGGDRSGIVGLIDAVDPHSRFWTVSFCLLLLAAPFALWRSGRAPREERRRVQLFAAGVGLSALPISVFVLADALIPGFSSWFAAGGDRFVLPWVEFFILLAPLTITYSVVVTRALPVRVVLRQAARYGFAQGVVWALAFVPLLWIVWAAYQLRDERLADLLSGWRAVALLASILISASAILFRERARDAIDRVFFRDAYDTRRVLLSVARDSARVRRTTDWAAFLAREIDDALHVEAISVFVVDWAAGGFVAAAGKGRTLRLDSALGALLAGAPSTVEVDLERPTSSLRRLPVEDRHWLVDGKWALLVPFKGAEGELIAIVALASKRSELPYSRDDRELLVGLAGAAGATLEHRLNVGSRPPRLGDPEDDALAFECERCGRLAAEGGSCEVCSAPRTASLLPIVPLGKFRLTNRLGRGGMGVVYEAEDVDLSRSVAIKTLPSRSPEDAAQLRNEAKAMAAVSSPGLSIIYAVESWRGVPLLVTELMKGGTLEDRCGAAMAPAELASLGIRLSEALADLHAAGILHRDIKPSNIGFTGDGVPKLLDFGLAQYSRDARSDSTEASGGAVVGDVSRTTQVFQGICGTPLYMAPELLAGEGYEAASDVWALALVLCEVALGRNPFELDSWSETHRSIAGGLDARTLGDGLPAAVRDLFVQALAQKPGQRPGGASEFGEVWRAACSTSGWY